MNLVGGIDVSTDPAAKRRNPVGVGKGGQGEPGPLAKQAHQKSNPDSRSIVLSRPLESLYSAHLLRNPNGTSGFE